MISFKDFSNRKEWYLDGKLHRDDGPAIECVNGYKLWYQYGQLHRFDGPAVEASNGDKCWYQNGKRHRVDGHAAEYGNGDKFWYLDGKLHRIDGPAIEYIDGTFRWFIDECELSLPDINTHQIQRLFSIALALSPLELPPYIILWILEWSDTYISTLPPISVVKMLEGIRNSRNRIKVPI